METFDDSLGAQLDGAKIVRYAIHSALTLAWFGGHGIHAYDADEHEVGFWNVGNFAVDDATPEEVEAAMNEMIDGDAIEF